MYSVIILLVVIVLSFHCDYLEDGWKGIKPMKTHKSTVDKLLGVPKMDENGYWGYSTEDAYIQVNYSSKPCMENQYGRGKYDVPEMTVIGYEVHFRKTLKLSDVRFDREDYYRDDSGGLTSHVSYVNSAEGVMIHTNIQGDLELLGGISYFPSKADQEKHRCKK